MKKILLSTFSMATALFVSAQINNPDFEDWSNIGYDSLHHWTSTNDFANDLAPGIVPDAVFQETTTFSSGASSVKMETVFCALCGFAGAPSEIPGFITQTAEYTDRPESVSFDYQFNSVNGDFAAVAVILFNATDTIASTIFAIENSVATWTNYTVPFSYFSLDTPDSISVVFASSAEFFFDGIIPGVPPTQVGTEFWVDNLEFIVPTPGQASPVGIIQAFDVADNNNGLDLYFQFAAAQDETTIDEYRVFCVKEANAAAFNLATAQGSTEFSAVATTGSPIQTTFLAGSNDTDGDAIQNGVPYRVFVMSLADGTNATIDNISMMSNSITLNPQPSNVALNVLAADVDDNNNGTDLDVQFDIAINEATVGEYRILIVKSANAGGFNLAAAEAVAAANYETHTPNAMTYQSTQQATTTDVDGDLIQNSVPYRVFVLSVADGTVASINALSIPSNEITLGTLSVLENENTFEVFPNPVSDKLFINNVKGISNVTITDMSGRIVWENEVISNQEIDMSAFNAGLFVITLFDGNHFITKKIVKE